MGMILTLYLISANIYNSVEAPNARGFSYIEIWMVGTQIPILIALLEYGFILCLKKISIKSNNHHYLRNNCGQGMNDRIKRLDFAALITSLLYFFTFATIYWIIGPSNHT